METVVIELEQWLLDWLEIAGTVMSRSSSLFVLEHDVAKLLRSAYFREQHIMTVWIREMRTTLFAFLLR
jgi:hypothetical protein